MSLTIGQPVPYLTAPATNQTEFNLDQLKGQFFCAVFLSKRRYTWMHY